MKTGIQCSAVEQFVAAAARGQVESGGIFGIAEHLAGCPACRARYDWLAAHLQAAVPLLQSMARLESGGCPTADELLLFREDSGTEPEAETTALGRRFRSLVSEHVGQCKRCGGIAAPGNVIRFQLRKEDMFRCSAATFALGRDNSGKLAAVAAGYASGEQKTLAVRSSDCRKLRVELETEQISDVELRCDIHVTVLLEPSASFGVAWRLVQEGSGGNPVKAGGPIRVSWSDALGVWKGSLEGVLLNVSTGNDGELPDPVVEVCWSSLQAAPASGEE
jgi:hypothetical protein